MLIIVCESGNLSAFQRVTRACPCRCKCQVLVCWYIHEAMHNLEEHDQLINGSAQSWLSGRSQHVVVDGEAQSQSLFYLVYPWDWS